MSKMDRDGFNHHHNSGFQLEPIVRHPFDLFVCACHAIVDFGFQVGTGIDTSAVDHSFQSASP